MGGGGGESADNVWEGSYIAVHCRPHAVPSAAVLATLQPVSLPQIGLVGGK